MIMIEYKASMLSDILDVINSVHVMYGSHVSDLLQRINRGLIAIRDHAFPTIFGVVWDFNC
jgi:hypothetical protein